MSEWKHEDGRVYHLTVHDGKEIWIDVTDEWLEDMGWFD